MILVWVNVGEESPAPDRALTALGYMTDDLSQEGPRIPCFLFCPLQGPFRNTAVMIC